jgi:RNA polymerase sigma-70 factor (ECF subfamily)
MSYARFVFGLQNFRIVHSFGVCPIGQTRTTMVSPMSDFTAQLETQIPRLRRYARALTRDASRADDLVQSCLMRALAKQHLWQPGTDLRAWLFTLLHNQHVNDVRRSMREGVSVAIDDVAPILTTHSNALASVELRDLEAAMARLPDEQRQVILLVGLEGLRYEEVSVILGIPIGTVRSRLSRGRDNLRSLMDMEKRATDLPIRTQEAVPSPTAV